MNGSAIRELRKRTGYSGVQFASLASVDRAYLSNIELGHRPRVSPAVAQRLAQALNVPLAAILAGLAAPETEAS